jgi:hypothetical protein
MKDLVYSGQEMVHCWEVVQFLGDYHKAVYVYVSVVEH